MFSQWFGYRNREPGHRREHVSSGPIYTDFKSFAGRLCHGSEASLLSTGLVASIKSAALVRFVAGPEFLVSPGANLTVDAN